MRPAAQLLRAIRRRLGGLSAESDDAIVAELAVRLSRRTPSKAAAAVEDLFSLLPRRVLRKYVARPTPTLELDYGGARLRLMYSSPAIGKRARARVKEPFTVEWLERSIVPGDVVFDIGANVGSYALIAATLARGAVRVFAFEPAPANFYDLCRNIALNGCQDVITPLPFALWSHTGVVAVEYRSLATGAAGHRVGPARARPGMPLRLGTPAFALDDLVDLLDLPVPNHVKLDVDGVELEVLQGARRTLATPACETLLVEINRPRNDPTGMRLRALVAEYGFGSGRHLEREAAGGPPYRLYQRAA